MAPNVFPPGQDARDSFRQFFPQSERQDRQTRPDVVDNKFFAVLSIGLWLASVLSEIVRIYFVESSFPVRRDEPAQRAKSIAGNMVPEHTDQRCGSVGDCSYP